jgi:flagellar motor switch protein FliM
MADDPQKPITDFLDQSEIDKLLAQTVETQPNKPVVVGPTNAATTLKIEPYDFRNPAFLSEA